MNKLSLVVFDPNVCEQFLYENAGYYCFFGRAGGWSVTFVFQVISSCLFRPFDYEDEDICVGTNGYRRERRIGS